MGKTAINTVTSATPPVEEWAAILNSLRNIRGRFVMIVDGKPLEFTHSFELGVIMQEESSVELRWQPSKQSYELIGRSLLIEGESVSAHLSEIETFESGDVALPSSVANFFWMAVVASTLPRISQPVHTPANTYEASHGTA